MKKRLLLTGSMPDLNTGYSKPIRYLVPRFAQLGHTIAFSAYRGYEGRVKNISIGGANVLLLPPARLGFLNDVIEGHARFFKADAVISLGDIWLLEDWGSKDFNWYPRFPIDTHPISKQTLNAVNGAKMPLPLTKWGQQQLAEHGINSTYIPHGVCTNTYKPMNKDEARKISCIPGEFIVGMIASNVEFPCRKSIPEVLLAWRDFKTHGNPGKLYLHTSLAPARGTSTGGIDIVEIMSTLNLGWSTIDNTNRLELARADVIFPSQYSYWNCGYSDKSLAAIYNSFDVLLMPSRAEGFGIPIIEAQACGIPVITLAVTSMPELTVFGKCLTSFQMHWSRYGGWRGTPSIHDINDAIQWVKQDFNTTDFKKQRQDGIEFARTFDFDKLIKEYWEPLIDKMPVRRR